MTYSDDDLIRRGDALAAAAGLYKWSIAAGEELEAAIAALPAVTVGVPTDVRDYAIAASEAFDTMIEVALNPFGAWQVIQALAGHLAALEPVAALTSNLVDDSQTPDPAVNAPDPVHRPTMTDMMVDPDTLDAFMEANPLPPDPAAIRILALIHKPQSGIEKVTDK